MALGNPDRPVGGLAVRPPAGVELRPVARDDFADVSRLVLALHGGRGARAGEAERRASFEALVGDVDAVAFLAVAEEEPAGIVVLRFRRRLNWTTYEGWLSDWYVVDAERGRGIGRSLLDAVVAEWRLRGGHQVMVELRHEQAAARHLAERAGFEEKGRWFRAEPVATRGIPPTRGVEVRPAGRADFEAVTRLLAELGRPAPSEERLPALRRVFDEHVTRADTASLVATLEGTPVGVCSVVLRTRLHRANPEAWIPDLVVTERARGRDIGAALLDAAFGEAARRGAHAATLESGFQRSVAHRLYAAAGMDDVGTFHTLARAAHP